MDTKEWNRRLKNHPSEPGALYPKGALAVVAVKKYLVYYIQMSKNGYHFRFTAPKQKSLEIAQQLVKMWAPKVYIFGQEISKNGVEHCHAHLEFEQEPPSKDQRSRQYKKVGLTGNAKAYFSQVETSDEQNKIYVCKDLDLLIHNLSDDELDRLIQIEEQINENKKLSSKDKLLEEVKICLPSFIKEVEYDMEDLNMNWVKIKREEQLISFDDIIKIIRIVHIKKWKKLPPTKSLMFQYVIYIAEQLEICETEIELAYKSVF